MTSGQSDALRELLDRAAISQLVTRYAHYVWTKDVEALADLFIEDGEMATGMGEPLRGRQAIRETYARVFAADDYFPFIHNHVIDLHGDEARGRCYLDLRSDAGGRRMSGFGAYDDIYTRAPDGWKFRARALTMISLEPVAE
jgi:ketosteroid isomerase-like protein